MGEMSEMQRLILVVLMLCLVGADAAPVLGEEVHELSAEQAPEKDGETQKVAAEGAKAKKVVGVAKEKAKAATKVAEAAKQKAKEDAKAAAAARKKLDKLKGSEHRARNPFAHPPPVPKKKRNRHIPIPFFSSFL